MVLARLSGALTVLGIQELSNLLGHSPEFLEGVPRISHCLQKGFFGLECETNIKGRRPSSFDDSAGEDPDVELEESDGEEEVTACKCFPSVKVDLLCSYQGSCLMVSNGKEGRFCCSLLRH